MDMGRGKVRVRCMERVTWKLIMLYVKQPNFCCMAQETQTGALYQSKGGIGEEMRESFKREGIYMYQWLILIEV